MCVVPRSLKLVVKSDWPHVGLEIGTSLSSPFSFMLFPVRITEKLINRTLWDR